MQAYSNPKMKNNKYALPDVEIFYVKEKNNLQLLEPGWYWWVCLPGCLPDSDPVGAFETQEEAYNDAVEEHRLMQDDEEGGQS